MMVEYSGPKDNCQVRAAARVLVKKAGALVGIHLRSFCVIILHRGGLLSKEDDGEVRKKVPINELKALHPLVAK